MTRYEQGFMTKCAEHGVPAHVAGQMLNRIGTMRKSAASSPKEYEFGRAMHNTGTGLHSPIDNLYRFIRTSAGRPLNLDPQLPGDQEGDDLITQLTIDRLPDPGPDVRNPTPYELYQFADHVARHPKKGDYRQQDYVDHFDYLEVPGIDEYIDDYSIRHASPELAREVGRRAWHSVTNQYKPTPYIIPSPTPVK